MTSITIPSTVTSIEIYAFERTSNLTSVTFAEGSQLTSIGQEAFRNASSLTSITIPSGVTSIGNNAFEGARSLTSITIPSSVTSIGDYAFLNATALTSVIFAPDSQLTSLEDYVFYNTSSLTSITIPPLVTSIHHTAFQLSGLTSALVSVDRLGTGPFPLAAGTGKTIGGKGGVTVTTYKAFIGTGNLTDTIVANANLASNNISNVVISGYTIIGYGAFNGASSVTSITIPASVTEIDGTAFQGMTALTSITIPSSVKIITPSAFNGMTSLTSIDVESSNSSYKSIAGVLLNNTETTIIQYPLGKTGTTYTIPSSVKIIGDNAFRSVSRLTSITIPSSVTELGSNVFQGATSLASITIPASVTYIGGFAFQGASSLTSVIFEPDSQLRHIGVIAFQNATALTAITIPSGVTSIELAVFEGASSLTSITIPSSVTSINSTAFSSSGLTTVTLPSPNGLGLTSPSVGTTSFFGRNVTIRRPPRTRDEIVTAVRTNVNLSSLLSSIGVNTTGMSTTIEEVPSDSNVAYRTRLTIPSGNLGSLSEANKLRLINKVKEVYASEMDVNINKFLVTLSAGSIIVTVSVLADGITEAMIPICFPKGTPVTTNQGVITIEKLNPDIHTIRGKKIVAITQSRPLHKYIISIETDAFGKNVPSAPIQISKEHKVFYKGKMAKANELVEVCEGVTRIPYSGETLYNVLMEKHDNMMINNVICETLDPKNIMAKICGGKYNRSEQDKICKELNDIIKTDNIPAYKKLYASLK